MITKHDCTEWFQRAMALLLALLLLSGSLPGLVPDAHAEQNGMVRVKLTRLGSRSSLTFSANCTYHAAGVSVPAGAAMTASAVDGRLYLTVNGTRHSMGDRMTLARKGSGMSGIRFSSPSVSNVFCGDLVLYANGSTIVPVLHIYIEDYLYGVVAYEMSNGYPLEALKAQAVAARNYAMMMVGSRKNNTYDVTDNTNSQVFKGYNSNYSRVIQAVNETAGYMLYSGGKLARCYYSASNGGQTDSTKNVWGGSLPYSVVADDPYDLEATGAEKRYTTIPRYPTASNPLNSTLRQWLIDGIASDIARAGLSKSAVSIDEITAITPHSPKYAAPSILYTKLKFTMKCSGKKADGQNVSFTAACDVATYSKLETLFKLSINSGSNETIMVTKNDSSYTITFRRFGHGVGMSQHGARIMALNHGKRFQEILSFYYPGATLKKVSLADSTGSTSVNATVPPEDTNFAAGDVVEIRLSNAKATLNLRAKASSDSEVLTTVPHGARLTLRAVENGWGQVDYDGVTGYILLDYAAKVGGQTATPEPGAAQNATIQLSSATSKLNVRENASTSSAILTQVKHGTMVQVLAVSDDWAQINVNGVTGYVMTKYLKPVEIEATPEVTPEPGATAEAQNATIRLSSATSKLNVREEASTSSAILTQVKHGTMVQVLSVNDGWAQINVNGVTGYVMTKYLEKVEATATPEATPEPVETTTPEPGATAEAQNATIRLSSASSKLNVREKASTSSAILTRVKHGTTVQVLSVSDGWAQINVNGVTGYVMTKYLEKVEATATPEVTPEPVATTTPEPSATAEVQNATIQLSSTTSKLNVREKASTSSAILTRVKHGTTVQVLSVSDGWAQINVNGVTGYVMTKYLEKAEATATPEATPEPVETTTPEPSATAEVQNATIRLSSATSKLNVREKASTSSAILTRVKHGTAVQVLSVSDGWAQINVNGVTGYVMTKYLSKAAVNPEPTRETEDPAQPEPTALPEGTRATVRLSGASSKLNVRAQASTSSSVVTQVKHGTAVQVLSASGDWAKISVNGKTGYVMTKYLQKASAAATEAPTATPESTARPSGGLGTYDILFEARATANVNMRDSASTASEVIVRVPKGATVEVVDYNDEWCYALYGEYEGFIAVRYLKKSS